MLRRSSVHLSWAALSGGSMFLLQGLPATALAFLGTLAGRTELRWHEWTQLPWIVAAVAYMIVLAAFVPRHPVSTPNAAWLPAALATTTYCVTVAIMHVGFADLSQLPRAISLQLFSDLVDGSALIAVLIPPAVAAATKKILTTRAQRGVRA